MSSPFQSIGIVFVVTLIHVVIIAVFSSRNLSDTTTQRQLVVPQVDTVEVMPELLVSGNVDESPKLVPQDRPDQEQKPAEIEIPVEKNTQVDPEMDQPVEGAEVVKSNTPEPETKPEEKPAEHWEDSAYARRVKLPNPNRLEENNGEGLVKHKPHKRTSAQESAKRAQEPLPGLRTFSPIPSS